MDRWWSTRRLGQREIGFSDGHCVGDLPGQSGEGKPEENLGFKCSAIPQESRENTISAWTLNHPFSRSFSFTFTLFNCEAAVPAPPAALDNAVIIEMAPSRHH